MKRWWTEMGSKEVPRWGFPGRPAPATGQVVMQVLRARWMTCLLGLTIIVTSSSTASAASSPGNARYRATSSGVPPLAQDLARRLHLATNVIEANQPGAKHAPWTLWFSPLHGHPPSVPVGSPVTLAGGTRNFRSGGTMVGRVLSVGPAGAQGEFHYYDIAAQPRGTDPFRGRALSVPQAREAALAWLRTIGVTIPRTAPHVTQRAGATLIGGTGLCCFHSLTSLTWTAAKRSLTVYLADASIIVQADVTPLAQPSTFVSAACTSSRHRMGVLLGRWCIDYRAAANLQFIAAIGGHEATLELPQWVAASFTLGTRLFGVPRKPLQLSASTRVTQTFIARVRTRAYRVTVAQIFPRLTNTIWAIISVTKA